MKHGRFQCKDVPDVPILEHLEIHGGIGCSWWYSGSDGELGREWDRRCILNVIPDGVPGRVVLAKMNQLIRRGLVDGCTCGCRGDFQLTEKGKAWVIDNREVTK